MEKPHTLSSLSRIFLVLAAILIAVNIFLPIWRIDLYAPQYPEGLGLLIYADGLRGDVEIINGLNHYIGMQELYSENFIEFSILRYLFAAVAIVLLIAAWRGTRRWLYGAFGTLLVFGIVSMIDFYRWNYDYGHNLDPHAAIQVPGMAYQPPLIGFKQLLNFGAYSIPDLGGWCMVAAGLLLILAIAGELGGYRRLGLGRRVAGWVLVMSLIGLSACGSPQPRALELHKDVCAFCKMNVSDAQYATQLVTVKGRQYMFDDILCMEYYIEEESMTGAAGYVSDFLDPGQWVPVESAVLLEGESFRSPMGGNTAAFAQPDSADVYRKRYDAKQVEWK